MCTHLLSIETSIVGLDDNVLLAGNVQACGLDLLGLRGVFVGANDFLQLGGTEAESRRSGPYRGAFAVEDGGLIDVPGADKTEVVLALEPCDSEGRMLVAGGSGGERRGGMYLVSMYANGRDSQRP